MKPTKQEIKQTFKDLKPIWKCKHNKRWLKKLLLNFWDNEK